MDDFSIPLFRRFAKKVLCRLTGSIKQFQEIPPCLAMDRAEIASMDQGLSGQWAIHSKRFRIDKRFSFQQQLGEQFPCSRGQANSRPEVSCGQE